MHSRFLWIVAATLLALLIFSWAQEAKPCSALTKFKEPMGSAKNVKTNLFSESPYTKILGRVFEETCGFGVKVDTK